MLASADEARDDEAPESGVRPRVVLLPSKRPRAATSATEQTEQTERELLGEVFEDVFFETWGLVRALSPIQQPLRLGPAQVATAVLEVGSWPIDRKTAARTLRRRWPELVPGTAALDCMAHLMVDQITKTKRC